MLNISERFPVGGSRQAVYDFLQSNGFMMSKKSDKEWTFGERTTLLLYGAGSQAVIYSHLGNFKGALDEAVAAFQSKLTEVSKC